MFIYKGVQCPICKKELTESDEITVCPRCGTPHHKHCYLEAGHCANESLHATGFIFSKPSVPEESEPTAYASNEVTPTNKVCSNCGFENSEDDTYCRNCGNRLTERSSFPYQPLPQGNTGIQPLIVNSMDKIDGIPVRDWLVYLGSSGMQKVSRFILQNTAQRGRFGFSFAALLFPIIYALSYKLWPEAILLFLASFLSNLPAFFIQFFPKEIANMTGLSLQTWTTISLITYILFFIIRFIFSLLSDTIIRKRAGNAIRKIRNSCTNETEYAQLLTKKACPPKVLLGLIAAFLLLSLVLSIFNIAI